MGVEAQKSGGCPTDPTRRSSKPKPGTGQGGHPTLGGKNQREKNHDKQPASQEKKKGLKTGTASGKRGVEFRKKKTSAQESSKEKLQHNQRHLQSFTGRPET